MPTTFEVVLTLSLWPTLSKQLCPRACIEAISRWTSGSTSAMISSTRPLFDKHKFDGAFFAITTINPGSRTSYHFFPFRVSGAAHFLLSFPFHISGWAWRQSRPNWCRVVDYFWRNGKSHPAQMPASILEAGRLLFSPTAENYSIRVTYNSIFSRDPSF